MSMLTPPGMGGPYRIKGDRYPRMRRPRNRRRIVLATATAALATGLVGWGTVQLVDVFTGGGGSTAEAAGRSGDGARECTAQDHKPGGADGSSGDSDKSAGKQVGTGPGGETGTRTGGQRGTTGGKSELTGVPKPAGITVNVLNATARSGLAADTAAELKKRGFKVGEVSNAPKALDKKVKGSGLLIGATGPDTSARFEVLGSHLSGADTRYDERKGADVDLVLGDAYKKLTPAKTATRAVAALSEPKPSPSC
ncbi:LytR C-terminal domain-containing protein [Streptomyces sp. NPDC054784]